MYGRPSGVCRGGGNGIGGGGGTCHGKSGRVNGLGIFRFTFSNNSSFNSFNVFFIE